MKIERIGKRIETIYKELVPGEVFEIAVKNQKDKEADRVYMVTSKRNDGEYYCVNLDTGIRTYINPNTVVRRLPAKLVIGGNKNED